MAQTNRAKGLVNLLKEWKGFDMMWDAMQHEQRAEMVVAIGNYLDESAPTVERTPER